VYGWDLIAAILEFQKDLERRVLITGIRSFGCHASQRKQERLIGVGPEKASIALFAGLSAAGLRLYELLNGRRFRVHLTINKERELHRRRRQPPLI
jgi:hypothetical protein